MDAQGWVHLEGARKPAPIFSSFIAGELFDFGQILLSLALVIVGLFISTAMTVTVVGVNLDSGRIRYGRKSIAFAEITVASLQVAELGQRSLSLKFGNGERFNLVMPLRDGERIVAIAEARKLLAQVLAASSIQIPTDKYDPKGKFARFNFPTNVTREQAIQLVLAPPAPGEPLPISVTEDDTPLRALAGRSARRVILRHLNRVARHPS
ncbi:MAG: hypothetical protein EPN91_07585 [Salinibacterium sp.]|nr:MAG: hypothetical protein EPN91_07585 [Salinibacterium sp.]